MMKRLVQISLLIAGAIFGFVIVESSSAQRVTFPTSRRSLSEAKGYPWHHNITCTVFWVGESPSAKNPTPNRASSWDTNWQKNFGGKDDPTPRARLKYRPSAFIPRLNPFYLALPYNDCLNHREHKPEARRVIPWFPSAFVKSGKSVCHGRWVEIRFGKKFCFAQWEDCGPFSTDDWHYVFGKRPPKNQKNNRAGIDLSPAVRDYLKLKSGDQVSWRFVPLSRVAKGPWKTYGTNNPFVKKRSLPDKQPLPDKDALAKKLEALRRERDERYLRGDDLR